MTRGKVPDTNELIASFAPLTPAEASLIVRRLEDDPSRDVDDVVAEVKGERCGPAVDWDAEYALSQGTNAEAAVDVELEDGEQTDSGEPADDPVLIVTAGSDDEVAALVSSSTIDALEELVGSLDDGDREAAVERIVAAEEGRGDSARATLAERLGGAS